MTPQDLIERYVHAVAHRLPADMRDDVAAELRELIAEGVAARAPGGAADAKTASDYLVSLGPPSQFALRYSAPPPIIEPVDAGLFSRLAIGLLLTLAILAVAVLLSPADEASVVWKTATDQVGEAFTDAALKVLGLLLALFWMIGVLRRRTPDLFGWKPGALPPARDPDKIHRAGYGAAVAAWLLGFLVLMQPGAAFDLMFGGQAPAPLHDALRYDEAFSRLRAPVLWTLLGASLAVFAWATVEGRWRALTRRIMLALSLAIGVASLWIVTAGDIFVAAPADQAMKFAVAANAGFSFVDAWRRFREHAPPPAAPRPAAQG